MTVSDKVTRTLEKGLESRHFVSVTDRAAEFNEARRQLDDEQFKAYVYAREHETGHGLSMVIATRRFPAVNRQEERWRMKDERPNFGREVPSGIYQHGLASYPGDPEAFVSSRHEARKVAEKKGLTITDEPINARCGLQNEDINYEPSLGDLLSE